MSSPLRTRIWLVACALLALARAPARAPAQAPAAASPPVARGMERVGDGSQPLEPQRGPKRFALCIGIDGYRSPDYPPLRCAVSDAKGLAKELAALGYETRLMTDDAEEPMRPTYVNMDRELHDFAVAATNPDDTLLLTFAGHGDVAGGQSGLLPLDYGQARRLITFSRLLEYLSDPQCRAGGKLLVLDACRSSAERPERRMSNGFLQSLGTPQSFLVLSGCGQNQSSLEDVATGHGRLTGVLLDGLAGAAFGRGKEFLQAEELTGYVQATFRERQWVETQSPELLGRQTAKVAFTLARRELPKPPPLSRHDRKVLADSLRDAAEAWKGKEYADAVDAATTALRIDANSAEALAQRALAYHSLGYPDKAGADSEAALAADPGQLLAMQVRGMALSGDNSSKPDQQEALALLRKVTAAVDADPGRWPVLASGELGARRFIQLGVLVALNEGDNSSAATFLGRAAEVKDAPAEQVALALIFRGITYVDLGQPQRAVEDYTRVIEMKDAPAAQVARAMVDRGEALYQLGQPQRSIEDFVRVIGMKGAPVDLVARATLDHGVASGQSGQPQREIDDYTRVIEMKDAPADQVALALANRGLAWGRMGQPQRAVEDYDRAIGMKDVPAKRVAEALLNRGIVLGQLGQREKAMEDYSRVIDMKDAPADQVARALIDRGVAWGQQSQPQRAVEDYTRVIDMKDAPAEQVALAIVDRGITYVQLGQPQRAVEDYTRAIEMKGAPAAQVALALVNRGIVRGNLGRRQEEVEDYTRVIDMKDAPIAQVVLALVNRGVAWGKLGQRQRETDDYTRVIEMKDAPVAQVAWALVNRGLARGQLGQPQQEVEDYTRVIEMKDVPAEQVANALLNRGIACGNAGQWQKAMDDYTRIIDMKGAPAEQTALALVGRGFALGRLGQWQKAVDDYTRVIDTKDASAEAWVKAQVNRGIAWGNLGQWQKEVDDCTRVIDMKDAPADQVALALVLRGVAWSQLGQPRKEAEDCTRVINMKDAPAEVVGQALGSRGWAEYQMDSLPAALADTKRASEMLREDPAPAYNLGVILLRQNSLDEAKAAYGSALKLGPLAGAVDDLVELRDKLHGPPETAAFLGWVRARCGQREQGVEDLRQYLREHPDGPAAGWAKQWLTDAEKVEKVEKPDEAGRP